METAGSRYTAAQKNAVKSNLSLGYPAMLIQLLPSGENPSSIAEFLTDYRKEALLEKRNAKNEETSCSSSPAPSYRPALLHHFKKG